MGREGWISVSLHVKWEEDNLSLGHSSFIAKVRRGTEECNWRCSREGRLLLHVSSLCAARAKGFLTKALGPQPSAAPGTGRADSRLQNKNLWCWESFFFFFFYKPLGDSGALQFEDPWYKRKLYLKRLQLTIISVKLKRKKTLIEIAWKFPLRLVSAFCLFPLGKENINLNPFIKQIHPEHLFTMIQTLF